ncbi:MAG: hypothetical protein J7463_10180 [Roseiflexus sp.]|jgi:dTDP-4-amino-4,6-dideoxygalactose transaminase|nr:hypothetical protein [Roseiflexus sp.]MBO9336733.1 hypothetical protein [Roseiflexus sp.]MBO9381660.1 hypothetical protein [Roseiflexus sp.]
MATLAINGGSPVRTRPRPRWPQWDAREEQRVLDVLRSDDWGGFAPVVEEFERAFARATHCPNAKQTCREAIWLPQWLLLADPHEMDDVVTAVIRIRDHRDELRYAASL